ncbi:unnamed protein product, partial [Ectocarpus sp. 12 AP-2014]
STSRLSPSLCAPSLKGLAPLPPALPQVCPCVCLVDEHKLSSALHVLKSMPLRMHGTAAVELVRRRLKQCCIYIKVIMLPCRTSIISWRSCPSLLLLLHLLGVHCCW